MDHPPLHAKGVVVAVGAGLLACDKFGFERSDSTNLAAGLPMALPQWPLREMRSLTVARQRGICTRFPAPVERRERANREVVKDPRPNAPDA